MITISNSHIQQSVLTIIGSLLALKTFVYLSITTVLVIAIGNNLKTSKKWNTQGSWNGTIILTKEKIKKVVCFKSHNHKTMAYNN